MRLPITLLTVTLAVPPVTSAVEVEREALQMGTVATVTLRPPDRGQALRLADQAIRAIEQAEQRLSTWRPTSEVSRLHGGEPE